MLKSLNVQNVALISSAEIEFEKGLNVLTGETGAGKSILIDSIGLLLGDRIDKTLIRNGENQCKVIGCFDVAESNKRQLQAFCEKYDLELDDEILISRSFNLEGKSQIRVNGQPITLTILKELTSILVDSYGQHESYFIFDTTNHLKILDDFCNMDSLEVYKEYKSYFEKLKSINSQIRELGGNDEERQKTIEYLKYQINEIEQAEISQSEFENLKTDKKRLLNIGKIISNTVDAYNYLNENVVYNLSKAKGSLQQASNYDENLSSLADRLESVNLELADLIESIENYNRNSNFDEIEQNRVEERLNLYNSFFRKYGKAVEEILIYYDNIKQQCADLINAKERLDKLQNEKSIVLCNLYRTGKLLHNTRVSAAEKLCDSVINNLSNLNMSNCKLKFYFEPIVEEEDFIFSNGLDKVEILFSANLGEPEKPLNKIASGGEISRFMLALKSVIAQVDNMPTMIFDEIDTGISGNTSEAVAKQMAIIAKNHQVIVVTHSQHITAMADVNFLIYKNENDGKTYTNIKKLDDAEKINEVARFMSGSTITDTAILNAKELIAEQIVYKQKI